MEDNLINNEIKKDRKSLFITIFAALLALCIIAFIINFAFSHANDNSNTLLQNQIVDGLEFNSPSFENNKLEVDVKNSTSSTFNLKNIDVNFFDSNNNLITSIYGYIGNSIDKNGIKKLVVQTDLDLSNATSVTYVINK